MKDLNCGNDPYAFLGRSILDLEMGTCLMLSRKNMLVWLKHILVGTMVGNEVEAKRTYEF